MRWLDSEDGSEASGGFSSWIEPSGVFLGLSQGSFELVVELHVLCSMKVTFEILQEGITAVICCIQYTRAGGNGKASTAIFRCQKKLLLGL